jgi:prophage regulatory protein
MADSILRLPAVKGPHGLVAQHDLFARLAGHVSRAGELGRAVGWVEDEIQSWLAERIAASRKAAA